MVRARANKGRIRTMALAGAALIAVAGVAIAAPAAAQTGQREYSIQSQDLGKALREFAIESGIDVVFDPDLVRGKTSTVVRGRHSAEQALQTMLRGTNLVIRRTASGGFTVAAKTTARSPQNQVSSSGDEVASDSEEIVVTGTNIKGAAPRSSPVQTISRQDIESSGVGSLADYARLVPQNLSSFDASTTFVATGGGRTNGNSYFGASFDLRGLGAGATLTLLNGHRLAPAGANGANADISFIPVRAIENVTILTDGASAIYGTDAIGGVVNITLRNDFEGAQTSARVGVSGRGDAGEYGLSQLLGARWAAGNVIAAYDFAKTETLFVDQRPYLNTSSFAGRFSLLPTQERHSGFLSIRQELGSATTLRADGLYGHRKFSADSSTGAFTTHTDGKVEQLNANAVLTQDLGKGWSADLSGTYARITQRFDSTLSIGLQTSNATTTDLSSLGIKASGPLVSLPGGNLRGAVGAEQRWEAYEDAFNSAGAHLKRRAFAAYGEVLTPLIGPDNSSSLVHRLELSIAGRYDRYDGRGAAESFNPKIGLFYAPVRTLGFRGTYGRSFRVPDLAALTPSNAQSATFLVPDTASPSGFRDTLFILDSGNADLKPEHAEQFTIGFDHKPSESDGLQLSGTYYNINYKDRIAGPPIIGTIFDIYSQVSGLEPSFIFDPPLALVQTYFSQPSFLGDFAGGGPGAVSAIFDSRLQNLASSRTEGVDFNARYTWNAGSSNFSLFANGNYIIANKLKGSESSAPVDARNAIFLPIDFRARAGGSWSRGGFSASAYVNYADGYRNLSTTPVSRVGSWTTGDLHLAYRIPKPGSDGQPGGFEISLSIRNITDARPPRLAMSGSGATSVGFDPVNATALGRAFSLSVSADW